MWAAAVAGSIPGLGGPLPSPCLHALRPELAVCTQVPLTLSGSRVSTPQGPPAGKSWAWAGDLGFCSFEWARGGTPSRARGHSGENTFLPSCLWALSGQALGLGGQGGGFWRPGFRLPVGFPGKNA